MGRQPRHMHAHSQALSAQTVISVPLNDYLTGYLVATGVIAALAVRELNGGCYHFGSSLTHCSCLAQELVEDVKADQYLPATMADLAEHAIDRATPSGLFTRIAPAVELSHTPAMVFRHPTLMGMDPDSTGWDKVSGAAAAS